MKCPKCAYLGFETGDRCKNCGYDFSLTAAAPEPLAEATIRRDDSEAAAPDLWLDRLDRTFGEAAYPHNPNQREGVSNVPSAPGTTTAEIALPLFNPDDVDDTPLISLPVAPRQPLSVRRTPEAPRLRPTARVSRPEPALNFREETDEDAVTQVRSRETRTPAAAARAPVFDAARKVGGRRIVAAAIDTTILLAIDLAVVYFTLRMAGLDGGALSALPVAPLLTFLVLLKVAYFTAFTAVGGQTIGKMAVHIRVVGDDVQVDSARAIRRTCAGFLSLLPLGLGFLPAFFGADRRALHDRLTQTRVVGLPSA